jgi:3',5'-cyclic AMP phosphodiesterase CpdA
MSPPTFLLAHLSDVHLAPMPRVPLGALNLKRALGAANWYRHRRHVHDRDVLDAIIADLKAHKPDHIAVTGDLVNLGLPGEHAAALRWLEALGPPDHVTVVPGNHDAYVRLRRDPGHHRWRAYMQGDDAPNATLDTSAGTAFPFVRRRGPVALIGLGSGVPTRPFESAGHLGPAQIDALRQRLTQAEQDGLARVVLIHHPPHRYAGERRTGLKDAVHLEDALRATGAEMVLHGHFHRAQTRWIAGAKARVPILGVPSASAALRHKGADLAGYSLYAVTRNVGGAAPGIRIEMIRRGMTELGGPIVERERTVLME